MKILRLIVAAMAVLITLSATAQTVDEIPKWLYDEIEANTIAECVLRKGEKLAKTEAFKEMYIGLSKARMGDKWESSIVAAYNVVKDMDDINDRKLVYAYSVDVCLNPEKYQ